MTAGDIYNVAGSKDGAAGDSGDGKAATAALLNGPVGVCTDPAGNLYITDSLSNELREVTATATALFTTAPAAAGITITQPDGSRVTFYPQQSGGGCTAPYQLAAAGGDYCTLPQDIAATLTFSSANGGTYTYSPRPGLSYAYGSSGALESETDAAGNTLTISYGAPLPGTGHCPRRPPPATPSPPPPAAPWSSAITPPAWSPPPPTPSAGPRPMPTTRPAT